MLEAALHGARRHSLAAVPAAMPKVGDDADIRREPQDRRG
jgi:hypothetical protein